MKPETSWASIISTVVAACVVLGSAAWAQDEQPMMVKSQSGVEMTADVDWTMCAADGVAVGGYDLVSYRQPNGPIFGSKEFTADFDEALYLFADQENLEQFLQDPQRFLPAYSGFCAITLALGRVTCPDYSNFKIEDNRLLLFEVTGFTNGRTLWNTDSDNFRRQADDNFGRLLELR